MHELTMTEQYIYESVNIHVCPRCINWCHQIQLMILI